jgi:predicted flavoprotein YhiN
MIKSLKEFVIIGGGAAGMFASLAAKEANPAARVILLEKSSVLLSKVRISGGGRCNVTHACFDPRLLAQNYPRGHKELLGPFHRFQPRDTISWFEAHGVVLKTEADGRLFPITDSSQTIIDCLIHQAQVLGVEIRCKQKVKRISRLARISHTFSDSSHTLHDDLASQTGEAVLLEHCPRSFKRQSRSAERRSVQKKCEKFGLESTFQVDLEGEELLTPKLLLATGNSVDGYSWAQSLGHTIQEPVPSLFTFNIDNFSLAHLSGITLDPVKISIEKAKLSQTGSLLITHFGFSGPAVLKLSAWAARFLKQCHYQTDITINWLPNFAEEEIFQLLSTYKNSHPHQKVSGENPWRLPKNLWYTLLQAIAEEQWIALSNKQLRVLSAQLHHSVYPLFGKTTHKEEFVTCGGISLNEIDLKTLESKICPGLFFAGEILDIDGVTGGFNFQNAWTTGYIAGSRACS